MNLGSFLDRIWLNFLQYGNLVSFLVEFGLFLDKIFAIWEFGVSFR
jgi:hypothetical protein